ncbi:MAG: GYD domain-containing protein [Thermodesulfobacteriota bacterium]
MSIFLLFGKYSPEAIKNIKAERTEKAREIIKKYNGKIISMYAVMGEHDLVFTIDFPDQRNALAVSVALYKLTGIHFTTSPVVDVEQFDTLLEEQERSFAAGYLKGVLNRVKQGGIKYKTEVLVGNLELICSIISSALCHVFKRPLYIGGVPCGKSPVISDW